MASVAEYLLRLGRDPAEIQRFKQDPQGAMQAAGLSNDQIDAIMKGDAKLIESHIQAEFHEEAASIGLSMTTKVKGV
jgi:hypothetical protein